MQLIKRLPRRLNKNEHLESWGVFECPICLKEVERLLSNGYKQKSCRCSKNIKHGETKTKLYKRWTQIKQRCNNLNNKDYKHYGGRGITICPEWTDELNGFINFRNWSLANGYAYNLEIDRENTNGNYEPNNCRWIIHKENIKNRRKWRR